MLIKDIKPIDKWGTNLLKEQNLEEKIDELIEQPLKKACRIFCEKGIQTVMSSANKNNILQEGEKAFEKEDIIDKNRVKDTKLCSTYEDAGKGYAWIMIDFETLSDENIEWLFSLEAEKEPNGEPKGEKVIWFVRPCEIQNPQNHSIIKKYNDKFEKRHIVLNYHWAMYPFQTVILRMPIDEETTVEAVEKYFANFARGFKGQIQDKNVDISGSAEER